MKNESKSITDMPYAKWLEHTLHDISQLPVRGIAIACILENGDTYTSYWRVPMGDKLMLSGLIQQDAMFDALDANGYIPGDGPEDSENVDGDGDSEESFYSEEEEDDEEEEE